MSRRSIEDLKFDLESTIKENININLKNYLVLEDLLLNKKVDEALEFVKNQIEVNKKG